MKKNTIKSLTTIFASLCVTGISQAATISVNNIDPNAGTYDNFTSTAIDTNTFSLTQTFDFDGGGTDDTLTFTLVRTTYGAGTISGADVTLGAVNNGGNTTNWYSNYGDVESVQFAVSDITYSSGEMDGTTAVFDGFQNISRINITAEGSVGATIDYLVHTGSVGSTTITSSGNALDLTSAGSSSSVFLTAEDGAPGIRLRDLDLQFSTVSVPEPSSTALLGLGGLTLILRRRK